MGTHLLHLFTLEVEQRTSRGQGGSGGDRHRLRDVTQGGNNQGIRLAQFTPLWIHYVFAYRMSGNYRGLGAM